MLEQPLPLLAIYIYLWWGGGGLSFDKDLFASQSVIYCVSHVKDSPDFATRDSFGPYLLNYY